MTPSHDTVLRRLVGTIRSPRQTLARAVAQPRSLALAVTIVAIAGLSSVAFLSTGVGRLAALDQQVRQLESFGVDVTEERYQAIRETVPYRPALTAAFILIGWPVGWVACAAVLQAIGNRVTGRHVTVAQVLTVVVHASSVLALRSMVALPLNYARESLGGATSVAMLLPAFSESSFAARLLSAVDLFLLWWLVLVAMGLAIAYRTRTLPIARWLFAAYAAAAAALALIQALRGGT